MRKTLTEKQRRVISYIEAVWMRDSQIPTPEQLENHFAENGYDKRTISRLLSDDVVVEALDARGIPRPQDRFLTPQQIALANTLLNLADTRSDKKKIQDSGVQPQQYAGWKRNPHWQNYMARRTEELLKDAIPDAHLALIDNVKRGDLGSLKFLYEITGRFSPTQGQVNIKLLLEKILEIITRHVSDQQTLLKIATDFELLEQYINSNAPVGSLPVVQSNSRASITAGLDEGRSGGTISTASLGHQDGAVVSGEVVETLPVGSEKVSPKFSL